jgi:tRNA threonylcarbamoyladenosine biosynthesis protein TsaB
MPQLLAIDSSTDKLAVALSGPAGLALHEGVGGAQASSRLVPEIMQLLSQQGLALADLDAIAFGRGPGAFTGLRTACAVAQGLALGAGKPVLALDSLMLVAEDARQQAGELTGPLWVAMDARMDEIYAAAYEFQSGQWQVLQAPALYAPAALVERWGRPGAVAGSALNVFPQLGRPERAWPQEASRARALAELAQAAWQRGELLDAAEAQPLYVRDKVALTTAERMAAGAGS